MNDFSRPPLPPLLVVIVLLGATACGTAPPPAATPPPAPSPVAVSSSPPSMPSSDAAEAPPTDPDVGPILQAFLDAPPLELFFHVDELPARAPLRILRNDAVAGDPPLQKFGEPVVYQDKTELADLPYLEITSIERKDRRARIQFLYDVEGVGGTAYVDPLPEGGFRAVRVEITER